MAGEADVKLKFTAFANMEAASRAFVELEQKFDKMQGKLKGGSKSTKPIIDDGPINSAVTSLGRYAVGLVSVSAAVKLISNEWQNVIDRQSKAGISAVTFEEAIGDAVLNIGSVMSPEKIKSQALKMSAETGVAPATAVRALSLAVKSGGATDENEALRLSEAAMATGKLAPRASAEKLADASGSVASVMTRTGATPEQAAGLLLSMQSKSNIADANEAMSAAGPTLANMLAQGASQSMAQALMPAMSQAIEDTKGDVSSLASSTFTQSLAEAGASRFKGQANIPDKMLAAMRSNPELSRQFFAGELDDLTTGKPLGKPELGRGKAETFLRSISGDPSLEGDATIKASYVKQFDEYSRQAISIEEAGKFYRDRLTQVQGATPTLQADRAFKGTAERIRIQGSDAAQGVTREGLEELLQSSGVGSSRRKLMMTDFEINARSGRLPYDFAENMLRKEAGTQTGDFEKSYLFGIQTNWLSEQFMEMTTEVTEERKAVAKSLVEAADAIRQLKDQRPRDRNGNVENN